MNTVIFYLSYVIRSEFLLIKSILCNSKTAASELMITVKVVQLGQRQDALDDMFWLMTFVEAASFIGSQVFGNWLIGSSRDKGVVSPYNAVVVLAIASIIYVARGFKENPRTASFDDYWTSFQAHIFSGKIYMLIVTLIF